MNENKKEEYLTAVCPNCSAKLEYKAGDTVVRCNCCDQTIPVSALKNSNAYGSTANADANLITNSIDTSESGLAYLDNFFETYDWDLFNTNANLYISSIRKMVEKQKIRNSNNAATWELEFYSIYTPVVKKIEGLKVLSKEIAERYTGQDDTDLLKELDLYSSIIDELSIENHRINKILTTDVKFFARFSNDAAKAKDFETKANNLHETIHSLKKVCEFKDIDEVATRMAEIDKKIVLELQEKGIDVESYYNEAVGYFNSRSNINEALRKFKAILGYKDSNKYIEKINKYFNFNDDLVNVLGENYTLVPKNGINKPKQGDALTQDLMDNSLTANLFSLCDIVDGKPNKTPLIKNVVTAITNLGENLFYIRRVFKKSGTKDALCAFNLLTKSETILDEAECFSYVLDKVCGNKTYDAIYFLKKRANNTPTDAKKEKAGCFSKKDKNAASAQPVKNKKLLNPFELVRLDLNDLSFTCVVDKMFKIESENDDNDFIFYTKKLKITKNKKTEIVDKFLQFDVNKVEPIDVLPNDAEICDVLNGKIIYTLYSPTSLNKVLYSLDLATNNTAVIEKNIYQYFSTIDDKVYYTVGNKEYSSLFSNNTVGSERFEVMKNVVSVAAIISGWMYVIKGYDHNRVLMKISKDGKNKVFICTGFDSLIKFVGERIYYLDYSNELHVVRSDGAYDEVLAHDIFGTYKDIIISSNQIFYVREELVSTSKMVKKQQTSPEGIALPTTLKKVNKNKYAKSIYAMDLNGHNIRKIAFDVDDVQEYDDEYIYFRQTNSGLYKQTTETKGKPTVKIVTLKIRTVNKLNKNTYEITPIVSLGFPNDTIKNVTETGCIKKKKVVEQFKVTFEKMEDDVKYRSRPVQKVMDFDETPEVAADAKQAAPAVTQQMNEIMKDPKKKKKIIIGGAVFAGVLLLIIILTIVFATMGTRF